MWRKAIVIVATVGLMLLNARPLRADYPPLPGGYDVEGPFVSGPASSSGMILGVLAAPLGGIVCSPVDLVRGATSQTHEVSTLMELCAEMAFRGGYYGVYYVVGAPFYLVKKLFWDAPKTLLDPLCDTRSDDDLPEQLR